MKKLPLVLFSISLLFLSCSTSKNNITKIQEEIASHEITLIYIWSESCGASKLMLEKNIKPYLDDFERNGVGIIIIYYGKENVVTDLKSDYRLVFSHDLPSPFNKIDANRTMKNCLKDYRTFNGFPIPILVDKDGFVRNYDEEHSNYSYWEIIQEAIK